MNRMPNSTQKPRSSTVLPTWRLVAIGLGATVVMGLLTIAYRHLDSVAHGVEKPLLVPAVEELTGHLGGVLLLAPLVLFAGGVGIARRPWTTRLAFHSVAVLLYSTLHTTLNWLGRKALFPLLGLGAYDYGSLPVRFAMELPKDLSIYVLVFVIAGLFERYRAARDQELRASELETRLAWARLHNLQAQLHPHFVFNTLNAVSSVMYDDVERADRMIAGLSDLLRHALRGSHRHAVVLAEELEVLGKYVEIMRVRFGDRLHFEIDVDDGLADALVPTLLLQPLVENAIRHGAPPPPEPAAIVVQARRAGDWIELSVEDNGPGIDGVKEVRPYAAEWIPKPGTGLSNTVERLRGLYGDEQATTLEGGRRGGLRVSIRIPYRTRPETRPEEAAWIGSVS